MAIEHDKGNDKAPQTSHAEVADALHNSVSMTHPSFNHLDYERKSKTPLPGPELKDLHIDGTDAENAKFKSWAQLAASNFAVDGNFEKASKEALTAAHGDDLKHGGGYKSVDKLLSYMNHEMGGSPFSLTRDKDKVILLDSRDGDEPKHDKHGKAILHPRETYVLKTEK